MHPLYTGTLADLRRLDLERPARPRHLPAGPRGGVRIRRWLARG